MNQTLAAFDLQPAGEWDAADIWIPVVVIFVGNMLFGVFCQIVKDNSWIDVWWGFTFVFPMLAVMIKRWV